MYKKMGRKKGRKDLMYKKTCKKDGKNEEGNNATTTKKKKTGKRKKIIYKNTEMKEGNN